MIYKIKLNFNVFLILFVNSTFSNNFYNISCINTNNGLSNNSVREIFQDSFGFLWFGTLNGLNRYDGNNFKYFYFLPGNNNCLSSNRIMKIFQDRNNYLWIVTYDKKLHRLDLLNNKLLNFNFSIQEFNVNGINNFFVELDNGDLCAIYENNSFIKILSNKQNVNIDTIKLNNVSKIVFLFFENKTGLWVGTDKGLYLYNLSNFKKPLMFFENVYFTTYYSFKDVIIFASNKGILYKFNIASTNFEVLIDNIGDYITCLNSYKDSILLIGTRNNGLFYYITTKNTLEHYTIGKNGLNSNYVYSIYADKYGLFWIINDLKGILCFNHFKKYFKYFSLKSELRENITEGEKHVIIEDKNNNLWISTYGSGLFKYIRDKEEFVNFSHNNLNSNTISSNFILKIYEDNCGNLWIGTRNGGVNKLKINDTIFKNVPLEVEIKNSNDNEVRTIAKDKLNRLWIGTKGGYLICYNKNFNSYVNVSLSGNKRFINSGIYTLFFDCKNNLWIGTKGEGIIVIKDIYKSKNLKISSSQIVKYQYPLIPGNFIYSINEDFKRNIWIGTYLNGIILIKNPLMANEIIQNYTFSKDNLKSLSDNRVRYLFFDAYKNLWVATVNGLNLLKFENLSKYKIEFIKFFSQNRLNAINYNDVLYIYQDKDSNLWIGTFGGGLNLLRKNNLLENNFVWESFFDYNNPSMNVIYNIVQDNNRNLWCATDFGLKKVSLNNNNIENYSNFAIINNSSFNESNALFFNDNVIVGHSNGLLYFNPEKLNINKHPYQLYITKIKISGEDFISGVEFIKSIKLKYNQNYIEFFFSLLDYYAPENIQYACILENYDKTWNYVGSNKSVAYKHLKSGKYIFKVKATNHYGVWNDYSKNIQIIIARPPWLSNIAISLYMFILILSVYFIYSYLHLRNQIVVSKKLYESKLNFFTNLSHELKTPLTLILAPVKNILSSTSLNENVKNDLKTIKRNVYKLSEIIEQMLDLRRVQEQKYVVNYELVNIIAFFNEIFNMFLPLAKQKEINFIFDSNVNSFECCIDKNILEKIVFNLLSNAFKNTPSGKSITLKITIDEKNKNWFLNVKDEGKGIYQNILSKIFERFNFSMDQYSNEISGSGLGLSLTYELITLLNGEIFIESKEGKGTDIRVAFPLIMISNVKTKLDENYDKKNEYLINHCNYLKEIVNGENYNCNYNNSSKDESLLVIEDDDDMRNYLVSYLSNYFYVIETDDGLKGIELARKLMPDLILCDIILPNKDGYQVCTALKNDFYTCHIPIIIITSLSKDDSKMMCYEIGADEYIIKPFDFEMLVKRIENLIKQRKLLKSKFTNDILSLSDTLKYSQKDKNFLETLLNYIHKNIEKNEMLSIENIVDHLKIGRTLFFKKIKTLTGLTPHELIFNIKMQKALELLKNTDLSIYEISFKLGFNDPDYFTKNFKLFYGVTPSELLKNKKRNR